jgi:ABC-2 type transport system permease protein
MMNRDKKNGVCLTSIASKGIRDMYLSPAAPFAAIFMLLGCGVPFLFPPESVIVPDYSFQGYASRIPFLAAFFFPALSAGLWDSERKSGTFDLLLSFPASEFSLAIAKMLPLFAVYTMTLLLTIPLALAIPGLSVTPGPVFSAGPFLASYCMLLLFGLSLSSFTSYIALRISGTIVPLLVSSSLILIAGTIHALPSVINLPASVSRLCAGTSLAWHLDASFRGIIDGRDIVFFIVPTVVCISLSALRLVKVRVTE